ncbi:MAG: hypothetical protein JXA69_05135 [Phycisphaerae bacterium]|nr:hypothetical protein [Phycisphaerae bacterium]
MLKKRTGLRICGARGHPVVRAALLRYASWLRMNYEFPIRVPVYLNPGECIITMSGSKVVASFFAPYDRAEEPYIRIATGDYPSLRKELGRDSALASIIVSMSHEVVHYQQWIETGEIWERGVVVKARGMLRRYEQTRAHP